MIIQFLYLIFDIYSGVRKKPSFLARSGTHWKPKMAGEFIEAVKKHIIQETVSCLGIIRPFLISGI
jgi:hypothetical protein